MSMTMTTIEIRDLTSDDTHRVPSTTRASRALRKSETHELNYSFGREDAPTMEIGTVGDLDRGDTAWVYDAGMRCWWLSEVIG